MGKSLLDLSSNPVRIVRKKLNKTVQQCADEAGIHWQAWYMTECGCYNDVPPKIEDYLYGLGYTLSESEYTAFRKGQQRLFGERFIQGRGLPMASLASPPIKAYREHIGVRSRTSFAKGLCVQPALCYKLETRQVRFLPQQIYDALIVAGVSKDHVEELNDRTVEYYEAGGNGSH